MVTPSGITSLLTRLRPWIVPSLWLATLLSAVFTYLHITHSEQSIENVSRVWGLLVVNFLLMLALGGLYARRIFLTFRHMKVQTGSSALKKRMMIAFGIVTLVPTLTVSIFAFLFFNLGIQTWFNERVKTALSESLAVAEAYFDEHRDNIRADALAMANDLNQSAHMALGNPLEFNRIVNTQAELRLLTEVIVFKQNRIIAQGQLSFALAFESVPQDALERAENGEIVIFTTEGQDKVRALVKLDALVQGYLLVGRLIDGKVLSHMEKTQGAYKEYMDLRKTIGQTQFTVSLVFMALALLLLLGALWYALVFAGRLTEPIAALVEAAEKIRNGDFSARVATPEHESKDEIATLSHAFNRMAEQLEVQRRDLIAAERQAAWSDVARRIAHEIKNPLTPIALSAERLKRKYSKMVGDDEAENFTRYTDTIEQHVGNIGRMVEEFVQFARIPNPVFAEVDIRSIIKKVVFSEKVAHAGIHYHLELGDAPLVMACDERLLSQLFINLLKNAAEAMEATQRQPDISAAKEGAAPDALEPPPHKTTAQDDEKPQAAIAAAQKQKITIHAAREQDNIVVYIRDSGAGFPETAPEKLFEPYVTMRVKGTGLGLAISKKIVEDHKGIIKLSNHPEGGGVVTVTFLQV